MKKAVKPICVEKPWPGDKCAKEYTHDAFGMVSMVTTTGEQVLFGSDLNHGQTIHIRVSRAKMQRSSSSDRFHADIRPFVDISLSHSQFAEFITNPNRGDGIPCTINYAPERGSPIVAMPAIERIESKAAVMKSEIQNSAKEQMQKVQEAYANVANILENGGGKKALKDAMFSLQCHISNVPGNMAFVVDQAEETLAHAVSAAKIDVESYIGAAITKLGVETAKNLGLGQSTTQGFLENDAS